MRCKGYTGFVRLIKWLRANIIFVLFVLAGVASFLVADQQSRERDNSQHAQLIQGCMRTQSRIAILTAAEDDVVQARIARGEPAEALKAGAYGRGLLFTIPAPAGLQATAKQRAILAQVELKRDANGQTYYTSTAAAQAAARKGCERAYGP